MVGVFDLQVQLGAFIGVIKAIEQIAERAGFAEESQGLFEIIFTYCLSQLQTGGGDDVVWLETQASGDFDCDQFKCRRRKFLGSEFAVSLSGG